MGTVTGTSIIDQAAIQLTDIGGIRWTREELLNWINLAQRQIVILSPNATNKVVVKKLDVGTRQTIPDDGWTLLEVIRYMGTDGTKPTRAIRNTSRELLDAFNPNWHGDTPETVPKHYVYDPQDQTVFFVYPPNNGKAYVQINYSPVPEDLATEEDTIKINDIFQPAILDYVLYRACSKDAEYAPGLALAGGYLQTFMATMGEKSTSELGNSPNQQFSAKNPSNPGSQS